MSDYPAHWTPQMRQVADELEERWENAALIYWAHGQDEADKYLADPDHYRPPVLRMWPRSVVPPEGESPA